MYTELILRPSRLADQVIYPDQARKMVASALDGQGIDPAVFGRDATGKTLQGVIGHVKDGSGFGAAPRIAFNGGRGFMRLYGMGPAGSELLLSHAIRIYNGVAQAQGPTVQKIAQGSCVMEHTHFMVVHNIHILVTNKKPSHRAVPLHEAAALAAIRRHIVGGLTSQAALLGLIASPPREEDIEVLEATPCSVPIQPGIYASAYKNVAFAMPYRLKGPWFAGLLRSRGYGLMRENSLTNPSKEIQ